MLGQHQDEEQYTISFTPIVASSALGFVTGFGNGLDSLELFNSGGVDELIFGVGAGLIAYLGGYQRDKSVNPNAPDDEHVSSGLIMAALSLAGFTLTYGVGYVGGNGFTYAIDSLLQ